MTRMRCVKRSRLRHATCTSVWSHPAFARQGTRSMSGKRPHGVKRCASLKHASPHPNRTRKPQSSGWPWAAQSLLRNRT